MNLKVAINTSRLNPRNIIDRASPLEAIFVFLTLIFIISLSLSFLRIISLVVGGVLFVYFLYSVIWACTSFK